MSLKKYNEKRNFSSTNEPKGVKNSQNLNRFVVQHHKARANHYDFRLEHNGVLISWAIPKGLSRNPKDKRLAVKVEDHPIDYINFEGIIPKGNYGAGTVEIFDQGNYMPIEDLDKGLKKGHIKIVLNGKKLKGGWSFVNTGEDNWIAVKLGDDYVNLKKENKDTKLPFKSTKVQLATLSKEIPNGKEWVYEIKYDGYRILSYLEKGEVKLYSRNNIDYTKKFKNVCDALKKIDVISAVFDGEIVSFDKTGRSDFGLLQENITKGKNDFYYVIFDILALNGEDLRNLPLIERKKKLKRTIFKSSELIIYSKHFEDGKASFNFAKQHNLEGIVAKNINSIYSGKRTEDWLKLKCYLRQEFVIAGYLTSSKNEILSALILGYYDKDELKYIGKVGTGFSEQKKKELRELFKNNEQKSIPFSNKLKEDNITWLKPKFVAEIQYTEITKDGLLRQPSFIGLRADKNAKDVTLEVKNE